MNEPNSIDINELKLFNEISKEGLKKIEDNCKILIYKLGQQITFRKEISNKIVVILSGKARLICTNQDEPFTLKKLEKGEIIGLASLLNVNACEETWAIDEVTTLAIPDTLIIDFIKSEPSFRKQVNNLIFPSEVYKLGEKILSKSTRSDLDSLKVFNTLYPKSKIISLNEKNVLNIPDNEIGFASSENIEFKQQGDEIQNKEEISSRGPLEPRIISIPRDLYNELTNPKKIQEVANKNINKAEFEKDYANPIPNISSQDLGQYSPDNKADLIRATGPLQESIACLKMLSKLLEIPYRNDAIEKRLRDTLRRNEKPSLDSLGNLMSMLGLQALRAKLPTSVGNRLETPSIIKWKESFGLVIQSNVKGIVIASPSDGWVELNLEELDDYFPEKIIDLLIVEKSNQTPEKKFGFEWFWKSIEKYKNVFIQVLVASFVVQLFGLASPLLIQVIIDKVINQRSLETLQILGFALVIVTVLGGILSSLRTFIFTETTNRIDTRLGAEVIDHLLRLPLNYFDRRPVGELGSRVGELQKIRDFLTGQALTTILDAAFSIIYIIVMLIYSWLLTLIALSVLPLQIILTLLGTPLIRRQIREIAIENANTQSHLVEVLTGIQTVKAQNVETISRWKWQNLYSRFITRTFEKTITGTTLYQTSQVFQQLSQLFVLWIGASLVLKGELSLGQLIAFRIISGYVTQPLLRLTSIWQNIQELRVSFERLADILDFPQESNDADKANIPLPSLIGDVDFKDLDFSFNKYDKKVLSNINLKIKSGTFVGIVGESGSGKSTLMKLLPRLYEINQGKILIDNYDISKVELYSLRNQIGIVPQDPLLFAGSVSENISLINPESSSIEITRAAKIACAHDFIMELKDGYSTQVEERGSNLSGGQRQRLAIARTILGNTKLLIMDEATSALDYNTEKEVCENLINEYKDCTVFFITHRLNTIKNADLIVMMHQGHIEEVGSHKELYDKQGRYYALFNQQDK